MNSPYLDIAWAIAFVLLAALLGLLLLILALPVIHRVLNRLTPHLDEPAEIARGNRAAADYFSRVTAATILGVSLIIAAATAAGIMAALH